MYNPDEDFERMFRAELINAYANSIRDYISSWKGLETIWRVSPRGNAHRSMLTFRSGKLKEDLMNALYTYSEGTIDVRIRNDYFGINEFGGNKLAGRKAMFAKMKQLGYDIKKTEYKKSNLIRMSGKDTSVMTGMKVPVYIPPRPIIPKIVREVNKGFLEVAQETAKQYAERRLPKYIIESMIKNIQGDRRRKVEVNIWQ